MEPEDPRLDTAVKEMLVRRRPVRPASAQLRNRVVSVVDAKPVSRGLRRLTMSVVSLALVLAVVGALAYVGLLARPVGPGASPTPAPTMPTVFDMRAVGFGIVHDVGDSLHFWPWIVAGTIVIAAGGIALGSQHLWRRIISAALVLTALTTAYFLTNQPGIEHAYLDAPMSGLIDADNQPVLGSAKHVYYVTASAGDPFGVQFDVTNAGYLPIQLLGVNDFFPDTHTVMYWTALWTYKGEPGSSYSVSDAKPFDAPTLAPGETMYMWLIGRAGDCALGALPDQTNTVGGASTDRIWIAYRLLGMNAISKVEMPFDLVEPERLNCGAPPAGEPPPGAISSPSP